MTLDFLSLYNECAGQPWSMYDSDAEAIDDLESALKISINKALSHLWNLQAWSFRYANTTINTRANKSDYAVPDGNIVNETIGGVSRHFIKYDNKFLEYMEDYELQEEKTGEPENFFKRGESLYIYPTPDKAYKIAITYLLLPYGLDVNDNYLYELKNEDDYINIPEKYEAMFKNCLISLSMMYAIAEETDENYSAYERQYKDALSVLMQYCKDNTVDKRIVI